jgi:DNA-binding CsgD family transcriptional regulator/GAF domain-containing protein
MPDELAMRLRACERVRHAIAELAQLGPVSQVIDHCAVEAAEAADLDRLLLSRIESGALVVERLHLRTADGDGDGDGVLAELRRSPVRLSYPLLECELLRRRQPRLVDDIDRSQPNRYAFHATMDWGAYVAVPIVVDGSVVGFLHGDRGPDRRPPAQLNVNALEHFAAGFALVFERAVLRRRLRDQRREIHRIATWAEARTGELSDSAIDLSAERAEERDRGAETPTMLTEDGGLGAHLTAREVDVLRLMADGMTNADIARTLFVSQGTVKFHVKNILRKMQAANRADASSRYLRLTLSNGSAAAATPTLR